MGCIQRGHEVDKDCSGINKSEAVQGEAGNTPFDTYTASCLSSFRYPCRSIPCSKDNDRRLVGTNESNTPKENDAFNLNTVDVTTLLLDRCQETLEPC